MTESITYNTELEQLLKENSEECESLSILHRMSYEKYNKRSNYINIPVIILSSAIGFITGIDLDYDKMNIILGVGSVFVGIIKSVDTYFQLAKRAESHRICSLQFSQISKKIQIELTLHRKQRATAENMMNIVKTDIKNMQDIAPLIDDDIIKLYNMRYRRYKRVKKPNIVNGLTEVKVNGYNNEREYEYASRQGSREGSPVVGEVLRESEGSYSPVVSEVGIEEGMRNGKRIEELSVEMVGVEEKEREDKRSIGGSSKGRVKGGESVESEASVSLGEIRIDKNGTQGMST